MLLTTARGLIPYLSISSNDVTLSELVKIPFCNQIVPLSSPAPPVVPTTNTAFQTYNGCGLPPLNDYTYTGYQAPCTTTVNGHVETLYPIVPVSDSSSFWGSSYLNQVPTPTTQPTTTSPSTSVASSPTPTLNTAFATGLFAQALQCPSPVTPTPTCITVSGITTIFPSVSCAPASNPTTSSNNPAGTCHTSGYNTFSIAGTHSICCPSGWSTTPLGGGNTLDTALLFCFTSTAQAQGARKRQVSTETLAQASGSLVEIWGLAFTSAGVVAGDGTRSSSGVSGGGSGGVSTHSTRTGAAASASATKSSGARLSLWRWGVWGRWLLGCLCCMFL